MSTMRPADDYSKGMQTIERAIIEGVWNVGRHVTAADFAWHPGRVAPDTTHVEVRIGRRAVVGIFSREEIEDAADRVDRPETLKTIERIIAEARQSRR
jgi:hypothetical protein